MSQSIIYGVENAVGGLLDGISGLNVYKSTRTGARLFPYVTIKGEARSQMLGNYTGVYDVSVEVNYSDSSAKISQENFDSEYCSIFEAFYCPTPSLVEKLNDESTTTSFYMARIISQNPTIKNRQRAWQRGLTLSIYATPSAESPVYLASLDFSDHRNSMYIPAI